MGLLLASTGILPALVQGASSAVNLNASRLLCGPICTISSALCRHVSPKAYTTCLLQTSKPKHLVKKSAFCKATGREKERERYMRKCHSRDLVINPRFPFATPVVVVVLIAATNCPGYAVCVSAGQCIRPLWSLSSTNEWICRLLTP